MTKKQWSQIKGLSEWTPEIQPVAVWEDMVFIGCVQPLPSGEQTFDFKLKSRFVLTSSLNLQTHWKFINKLFLQTEPDEKSSQTNSELKKNKGFSALPSLEKGSNQPLISSSPKTNNWTEDKQSLPQKPALLSISSAEAKHSSDGQPAVDQEKGLSAFKLEEGPVPIRSKNLKLSLPETEEERAIDSENETFPGRAPQEESNVLVMGDFKPKASAMETLPSAPQANVFPEQAEEASLSTENKDFSQTDVTRFTFNKEKYYEELWKKIQPVFCAFMLLKVKGGKIFHQAWFGRIKVETTDKELADLRDHSLFKIVQKGHPYHGFIVDVPANKKFFSNIGWNSYPKHITAIPIKSEKQELKQIFAGLSVTPLTRDKIKNIEKTVSHFFQSHRQKISPAA